MTRFARRGGGGGGDGGGGRGGRAIRGPARSYVRGRGGSRNAARAAIAGRVATTRLGHFLSGVATRGVDAAAQLLGLGSVVGQNVETVLAAIANAIAPHGATLEEAAARRATDDALDFLCERFGLDDGPITNLDALDEAAVREALHASVTGYIYRRWLQELSLRIEQNTVTARDAVYLERQIKQYIADAVRLDFSTMNVLHLDWSSPVAQQTVEGIYREAYSFLER